VKNNEFYDALAAGGALGALGLSDLRKSILAINLKRAIDMNSRPFVPSPVEA
jgi:hypothetical protein